MNLSQSNGHILQETVSGYFTANDVQATNENLVTTNERSYVGTLLDPNDAVESSSPLNSASKHNIISRNKTTDNQIITSSAPNAYLPKYVAKSFR